MPPPPTRPLPGLSLSLYFPFLSLCRLCLEKGGGVAPLLPAEVEWPLATYCPSLGPSPSIGGGTHRPLTAPVPFLCLLGLSLPLYFAFLSLGLCQGVRGGGGPLAFQILKHKPAPQGGGVRWEGGGASCRLPWADLCTHTAAAHAVPAQAFGDAHRPRKQPTQKTRETQPQLRDTPPTGDAAAGLDRAAVGQGQQRWVLQSQPLDPQRPRHIASDGVPCHRTTRTPVPISTAASPCPRTWPGPRGSGATCGQCADRPGGPRARLAGARDVPKNGRARATPLALGRRGGGNCGLGGSDPIAGKLRENCGKIAGKLRKIAGKLRKIADNCEKLRKIAENCGPQFPPPRPCTRVRPHARVTG